MSKKNKYIGLIAVVATAFTTMLGSSAWAGIRYDYSVSNPPSGAGAGIINQFSASYSDNSNPQLGISFDISRNFDNYGLADSAWLVVSNGENPRDSDEGLAILYLDFNSRDVYAYRYDNSTRRRSWQNPDNHIRTYSNALNVTRSERGGDGIAHRVNVSFNLDVSAIQNFSTDSDWNGSAFDDEIGVWFHTLEATTFTTSGGLITAFETGREGYLDRGRKPTTVVHVSEPAGLAAIGFSAIIGLALFRRRRLSQDMMNA